MQARNNLQIYSFITTDGHTVEFTRTRHDPNWLEAGGQPGMAPCMDYPWVKVPGEQWTKCSARSMLQTKNAIETNTLSDIKFFISQGLV
jgi:hypothetical protein